MILFLLFALVSDCNETPDECHPGLSRLLPHSLTSYSSIEEVLSDLPEDFRSSFSLVRKGSGLQPGTDEFPRVVMSHCDEPCREPFPIVAFHGNPRGQNYRTLEIAELNPKKLSLNFYVIQETDEGLHFSNPNPKECTNCHFKRPQLIWSPYPVWPTLYRPLIHEAVSDEERHLLEKFWGSRLENPRYQFLGDKEETFLSDDPSVNPNYEVEEIPDQPGRLRVKGISRALQEVERVTIARNLRAFKDYKYLKYTFAGIFSNCSTEDLIPEELADIFPDDFWEFEYLDRITRTRRHREHQAPINFAKIVTPQLLYFLKHIGVEPESWFGEGRLPTRKRQYLMTSGTNAAWAIAREALLDDDTRPMYEKHENWGGWPSAKIYNCELIGPVSKAALLELFSFR